PTEAEWEKAAKGPKGHRYGTSTGELWENPDREEGRLAHFNQNSTEVVGKYPANGYGLFDMAGNVWQWVLDWYKSGYGPSGRNPKGPNKPQQEDDRWKVRRGGSWNINPQDFLRAAYRDYRPPGDDRTINVGFRVVVAQDFPE
ncbi:MAG TPA: hypothetical protein DF383_08565, partial [Deltaproteobacteria bacterium]|nr:hypothetical protein [Deltaproteobacteria bacterium]